MYRGYSSLFWGTGQACHNFPVLVRITLDKAASNFYDDDDWNDDDYDDNDDEDDYTPSSKPSSGNGSSQSVNAGDVYEAIRLINAERVKAGLPELEIDSELMAIAAVRAEEISELYDIEHYRPDGRYFDSVFDDYGYAYKSGHRTENIDASRATANQVVVESWMNSPNHKANILSKVVTNIGVGYCYDANSKWKHYWVMVVAEPAKA